MSEPWWQELGPRWDPSTAHKPTGIVIDIHSHVSVPEAAEIARPLFRPEMDPRMRFQPEESTRYNRELRATQEDKFNTTGARLADMDLQGVDLQVLAIAPLHYFYWLDGVTGPRVASMQNDRIAGLAAEHPQRWSCEPTDGPSRGGRPRTRSGSPAARVQRL